MSGLTIDQLPECDGAIMASVGSEAVEIVFSRCKHVVHCSGAGDVNKCPLVSMDDRAVGVLAAEHLLECRLTNFAYYGWRLPGFDENRFEGFRSVLQRQGHDCHTSSTPWPSWSSQLTHEHYPQLLEWIESLPKPVGILALNDGLAHDLAGACRWGRIPVPEQVAIVGVDDDDLLCELAWPPLTSVSCDFTQNGYQAAKMLDRMMAGEVLSDDERWIRMQPLGITERQSTSLTAVDDPDIAEALRFIRERACDPCTVADILREVPVARRWLEKRFQAYLGRTPHAEIMRVRMKTARRLLLQPELSMVEVADRCGFAAVQSFTKAFRDAVGTTPAAYRRNRHAGSHNHNM